jgi:hypothetical protein
MVEQLLSKCKVLISIITTAKKKVKNDTLLISNMGKVVGK